MNIILMIVILLVLAVAQASGHLVKQFYPTDQSRHDQLDELNSFLQYYTESINYEINTYEKLGETDKELRFYIDAAAVVRKLILQSWLRNIKPDVKYSVPWEILVRQQAIQDITEDIKQIDRITPVADAILLFNKVDTISLLNDRKKVILFEIKSLEESIDKAKRVEDFDKTDLLKMWKSKLTNQLESVEDDVRQAAILKEMILQSYILTFKPKHGKTVKIKHSNGLMEDEHDFPVPPLDTLSVLQEINQNFL